MRTRLLEWTIIVLALVVVLFLLSSVVRWRGYLDTPEVTPVRVQVLNACGVTGLAGKISQQLREQGYDVIDVGNAQHIPQTLVVDRGGKRKEAKELARLLGVSEENVIEQRNEDLMLVDVTLILGMDFELLELQ